MWSSPYPAAAPESAGRGAGEAGPAGATPLPAAAPFAESSQQLLATALRKRAELVTPAKGLVWSPVDSDDVRMAGPTALKAVAASLATAAAAEAAAEALSEPAAPDFAFGTPVAELADARGSPPGAGEAQSCGGGFSFATGSSGACEAAPAAAGKPRQGAASGARGRRGAAARRKESAENTPVNFNAAARRDGGGAGEQPQENAALPECSWASVVSALASQQRPGGVAGVSPGVLVRVPSIDPMAGKRRRANAAPEEALEANKQQRRPLTPVGARPPRSPAPSPAFAGFR